MRLAAQCAFLRTTLGRGPEAGLVNLCEHIIREGRPCIGPFFDEHETSCGLWERKQTQHAGFLPRR